MTLCHTSWIIFVTSSGNKKKQELNLKTLVQLQYITIKIQNQYSSFSFDFVFDIQNDIKLADYLHTEEH
jgi:hypothetical protein